MGRFVVSCVFLLMPLLLSANGSSAVDVKVRIFNPSPPCGEGFQGFSGEATGNGVKVRFWSCARPEHEESGCHSKLMKSSGEVFSEIRHRDDGTSEWFLGGVDLSLAPDNFTEDQKQAISDVINSPEAELVSTKFWEALGDLGLRAKTGPLLCLEFHSQLFQ